MRPEPSSSPKPIRSASDISTPTSQEDGVSLAGAPAGNHDKAGETPFAGISELQALCTWFDENPNDAKAWCVLRALVTESIKAESRSAAVRRFTDEELAAGAGLKEEGFAWKTVEQWWKTREPGIAKALQAAGLEMQPFPDRKSGGGRGNKATTAWCLRPFVTSTEAERKDDGPDYDLVRYELDDRHPIRLSGPLQRLLFRGGVVAVGSWRYRLIRVRVLAPILVGILLGGATLVGMLYGHGPLTGADAAMVLLLGLLAWSWWDTWKPLKYALWDRISALPSDWLVGDSPAQLEVARTPSGKVIRLVRYVAPCPVCGAELQLDDGAPEHPRRMVGRCMDAPREHVFTFDPVTHTGRRMP